MDKVDREIFQILVKDARMPFSRVGKMLGISTDLVKKRYQGIKDRNPNLKSTVILAPEKMRFKTMVSFYIKVVSEEGIPKVLSKISNYQKRVIILELIGDFDLVFCIYAVDFEDFYRAMEYLERVKEIKEVHITYSNRNDISCSPVGAELLIHEVQ